MPIDGDTPVQLTDYYSINPRISPDGKWIACDHQDKDSRARKTAIVPFEGGKPAKIIGLPTGVNNYIWGKDSRSFIYSLSRASAAETNNVGNLWSFPLDGSTPKQLTNFKTEDLYQFD